MFDEATGPEGTDRLAALEAAVEARTRDLSEALEQRTALLHELDHRVKNNLQLMSSLMLLQVRREADPAIKAALAEMQARLNAVAVVHRRLFQNEDVRTFDVADFLRDIAGEIEAATGTAIECSLTPISAPASKAAPLALLINEVLGGPARRCPGGAISASLSKVNQGLRIEIEDCGVASMNDEAARSGFGQTIETLLSRQLNAQIGREGLGEGRVLTTLTMEF